MNGRQARTNNPPTITEVAKHAGVSVGTVSRVLNGYENITAHNLNKVREAIATLGYQRCRSAEMLVSRRRGSRISTGNIGLAFTGMDETWADHPLVAHYTLGTEQACRENGFHALVELCGAGETLPRCVRDGKVDGLLVKTTRAVPDFVAYLPSDFPVVSVGFNNPTLAVRQVAPDDRGAGWAVTEYLWQQGHRRIAFVCVDGMHPLMLARLHGYEGYLRTQRAFDAARVYVGEMPTGKVTAREEAPPDMTAALQAIWSPGGAKPTAIIVSNDWGAGGLYEALAVKGLRIPDDVSVLGFDNTPGLCTALKPQLSSYAVPFAEVARQGARELFALIENPEKPRQQSIHLVRGNVIERASVRRLAA